jgi:hypothetical protein
VVRVGIPWVCFKMDSEVFGFDDINTSNGDSDEEEVDLIASGAQQPHRWNLKRAVLAVVGLVVVCASLLFVVLFVALTPKDEVVNGGYQPPVISNDGYVTKTFCSVLPPGDDQNTFCLLLTQNITQDDHVQS